MEMPPGSPKCLSCPFSLHPLWPLYKQKINKSLQSLQQTCLTSINTNLWQVAILTEAPRCFQHEDFNVLSKVWVKYEYSNGHFPDKATGLKILNGDTS